MPDLFWLLWLFILAQFFVPLYQKQIARSSEEPQVPRIHPAPVRAGAASAAA